MGNALPLGSAAHTNPSSPPPSPPLQPEAAAVAAVAAARAAVPSRAGRAATRPIEEPHALFLDPLLRAPLVQLDKRDDEDSEQAASDAAEEYFRNTHFQQQQSPPPGAAGRAEEPKPTSPVVAVRAGRRAEEPKRPEGFPPFMPEAEAAATICSRESQANM